MKSHESGCGFSGYPKQFLAVTGYFSDGIHCLCPHPVPTPPRGGGIIPPHIKTIPESVDIRHSLLVIKVHKAVLFVLNYVVLFLAWVACRRRINAVRDWKEEREGDWGESILQVERDINI